MIDRGATTVWERWDGVRADGVGRTSRSTTTPRARSSRSCTATSPASSGWSRPGRRFRVAPRPGGGVTRAADRARLAARPDRGHLEGRGRCLHPRRRRPQRLRRRGGAARRRPLPRSARAGTASSPCPELPRSSRRLLRCSHDDSPLRPHRCSTGAHAWVVIGRPPLSATISGHRLGMLSGTGGS